MYAYDIVPKLFISGTLARAIKFNILTKLSNMSYARSIPKLQVTFWRPYNKRFVFNVHFTMASVLDLMHIGPMVKLLLICKWILVFYNDKQCLIFLYSIERDYCQHESVNVGWKVVKFLFKKISFDNVALEDVFVLQAAGTKTPACRCYLVKYWPCVVRDVSGR